MMRRSVSSADALELVRYLYEGCLDPQGWTAFLDRVSEVLTARLVAMHHYDFDHRRGHFEAAASTPSGARRPYAEYYSAINPFVLRGRPRLRSDRAVIGRELLTESELMRTEFYNDYLRPLDLHHSIGVVAIMERDAIRTVTALRSRSLGTFDDAHVRLLTALRPHLRNAFELSRCLGRLDASLRGALAALDQLALGVILVEGRGRVLTANRAAQEILERADGLALGSAGLRAERPYDTRALRRLIVAATGGSSLGEWAGGGTISLPRRSLGRPLNLRICPLCSSFPTGSIERTAAVFVIDPEAEPELPEAQLRRLFGLTPAEARIASLLVRGRTPSEAAEELEVTIHTARTHLKRVFAKTGSRRQAELVSLLLRSVSSPPPESVGSVVPADRRR